MADLGVVEHMIVVLPPQFQEAQSTPESLLGGFVGYRVIGIGNGEGYRGSAGHHSLGLGGSQNRGYDSEGHDITPILWTIRGARARLVGNQIPTILLLVRHYFFVRSCNILVSKPTVIAKHVCFRGKQLYSWTICQACQRLTNELTF